MSNPRVAIFGLLILVSFASNAQNPNAHELLTRSIEYHDPENTWSSQSHELTLIETRPNGSDRQTALTIDLAKAYFKLERLVDNHVIIQEIENGQVHTSFDGSASLDSATIAEFRLDDNRAIVMRDYYTYLYGLPMKILDPGTIIDPQIKSTHFQDQPAWEMRITYDPEVGEDIWYFYFSKVDSRMVGYRFYHDESANDGEYITLDGEAKVGSMRLPAQRKWYMHKDDRFLGTDLISNKK